MDAQWVEDHIVYGKEILRPRIATLQACDTGNRVMKKSIDDKLYWFYINFFQKAFNVTTFLASFDFPAAALICNPKNCSNQSCYNTFSFTFFMFIFGAVFLVCSQAKQKQRKKQSKPELEAGPEKMI